MEPDMADVEQEAAQFESGPRNLSGLPRLIVRIIAAIILILAVNQTFNLGFLVGWTLIDLRYYYAMIALGLFACFMVYPLRSGRLDSPPAWYDWVLGVAALVVCGYFFANAFNIALRGWEMAPPELAVYFSFALWLLVLEGGRRAGGLPLAIIVGVLSLYPIYTDYLPTAIAGFGSPPSYTAAYHAMGSESILGIPLRTFAQLIIGFLLFGAALQQTGAGSFFMNLSFALLGKVRGGPAKVAIFSSGLLGSMSGSVITNVLTTGVMTIPAMRRTGIRGTVAAGRHRGRPGILQGTVPGVPSGDEQELAGGAGFVTFADLGGVTQNDGTDFVLFEVQRETADPVGELNEFVKHDVAQPFDLDDAVTGFADDAGVRLRGRRFQVGDLRFDVLQDGAHGEVLGWCEIGWLKWVSVGS